MLETPRNIDKSLRSGNERSRVEEAKKSGLEMLLDFNNCS